MASACLQNPVVGLVQAPKVRTQVTASSKTLLHSANGCLFGKKLAAKGSGSIVKSSGRAMQIRNVASEPKAASVKGMEWYLQCIVNPVIYKCYLYPAAPF